MSEVTMSEVTIFFGKGEYAITSKNIDKLIEGCKEFILQKKWSWKLQDCLGIDPKGMKKDRYHQIMTALQNSTEPKVVSLLKRMSTCPELEEEASRVRVNRGKLGPRGFISESTEKAMLVAAAELGLPLEDVKARINKMREEAAAKKAASSFESLLKLGYSKEEISSLVEAKKASNE